MKNSKVMVDIVAKDGVVVIAIGSVDGSGVMTVNRQTVTTSEPSQIAVMNHTAAVLEQLTTKGIADRICVILPESLVLRGAMALKAKKDGVADIGAHIIKGWMLQSPERNLWVEACNKFGAAVKAYKGVILFYNARSLYRYEVTGSMDGADISKLNGVEATFENGVNQTMGLVVKENSYYKGTVKIAVQSSKDKDGNVKYRGFVPRFISCSENGQATTLTAFEASDFRRQLTAKDATAAVINALRLHVQAVAKLPHLQIATSVTVHDI